MGTVIDRETDARFAAQSGIGRKLDPASKADAPLRALWRNIQDQVKAEVAAGTLVTTFDHPAVAEHLAVAETANQAAAAHMDASVKASSPALADQHRAAAETAAQVVTEAARSAAATQPRAVTPQQKLDVAVKMIETPPSPQAAAQHRLVHKHLQSAVAAHPRDLLVRETDARFWATGYRPGHKLDKNDPMDVAMFPVWANFFRQVKAEDAAGKLALTYNHPVVAQRLADAQVADQAAVVHLEAAAADPQTAPQNIAAATTAMQIAAQKARGVAKLQPPPVSGQAAKMAAQQAARVPVGPSPQQQLARLQALRAGQRVMEAQLHHRKHRHSVRSTVSPKQVQNFRRQAAQMAHRARAPFVLMLQRADGAWDQRLFQSRGALEAAFSQFSDRQGQYRYVSAFDLASSPTAPIHDSVGVPAAEHAEVPPEASAPSDAGTSPEGAAPVPGTGTGTGTGPGSGTEGAPSPEMPPTPSSKMSFGKIAAIAGAGLAVVGGIIYGVTRRSRTGSRARTPRVLVATPETRLAPTRALRA